MTQQNTANAEESASATIELSGQASQMQGMLRAFKLTGQDRIGFDNPPELNVAPGNESLEVITDESSDPAILPEMIHPDEIIKLDD